jgi:RNA polymerase sigma-70 factor (sigma-E family)
MLIDVGSPEPHPADLAGGRSLRSFAEVFEEQRPRALRLAYAMTGDALLAEDVVAEAFARVYASWLRGGVRDPDAYVRRAVVNEVRTRWRRRAVQRRHLPTTAAREPSTPSTAESVADIDRLQHALSTLPPRVRAVVVLRIVDDYSEHRTAEVLGCSAGTVKSYLSRGLERLRKELSTGEGDIHG